MISKEIDTFSYYTLDIAPIKSKLEIELKSALTDLNLILEL